MELPRDAVQLGPESCRLLIRTRREGAAARVGHDLTITFEVWSGELDLTSQDAGSLRAEFDIESLKVVDGTGGALPLSSLDRREIKRNALKSLGADEHPKAAFVSTAITASGDTGSIAGDLAIRGRTAPVEIAVAQSEDGWRGSVTIRQTQFGITPYKAFLGALRLADEVRIEVELPAVEA